MKKPRTMPDSRGLNPEGRGAALVNMPFSNLYCASMALGLLKATLAQRGIPCDDYYFNLDFAAGIGPRFTRSVLQLDQFLLGEYVFSGEIFKSEAGDREYFSRILDTRRSSMREAERVLREVERVRRSVVPEFLDHLVESVDWARYEIIGFTSTYQQQAASLALAKRLRERYPQVPVIIGGFNVTDVMGLAWLRHCEYLDYVCLGEGDRGFADLIIQGRKGAVQNPPENIAFRRKGRIVHSSVRPAGIDLDTLPTPDYDTYYRKVRELSFYKHPEWELHTVLIEGSRGCWCGQKKHCAFCGFNNLGIEYRAKSPDRVFEEIMELSCRHMATSFQAVDNILDRKYIRTLFPKLADLGGDLKIFFELTPDLTLNEIRTLWRGGCVTLQPGVESLSTNILKLMHKTGTGIQKVFFLKWARYFNISAAWNVLSGFSGETEGDYRQQIAWFKLLRHLNPPVCRMPVSIERFSPLFDSPGQFGISNIRPHSNYKAVYPDPALDLMAVSHYFEGDTADIVTGDVLDEMDREIALWKTARENDASLTYEWSPAGFIIVHDNRNQDVSCRYFYKSPLAEIFEAAGMKVSTVRSIASDVEARSGIALAEADIRAALERFRKRGLLISENGRYLTLATPQSRRFLFEERQEAVMP